MSQVENKLKIKANVSCFLDVLELVLGIEMTVRLGLTPSRHLKSFGCHTDRSDYFRNAGYLIG